VAKATIALVDEATPRLKDAQAALAHVDPKWFKKLTLRRSAALTALWLMAVLLVPMFVFIGIAMGMIKGIGTGAHDGVMEAWRALVRAYELTAKE
jgi:hypothetical protein